MSLDFRHTCPEIDDCISDAELIIEEYLKDLIEQFLPSDLIDVRSDKYKEFLKDNTSSIFSNIKPLFEKLRSLNSEVRDKQIRDLNKKLEDMIRENKALGYRVSELEDKIIELNDR